MRLKGLDGVSWPVSLVAVIIVLVFVTVIVIVYVLLLSNFLLLFMRETTEDWMVSAGQWTGSRSNGFVIAFEYCSL